MKTVTMIDSYKERNGYLCWFLSVFRNNIFNSVHWLAMTISSNRDLLIQLHFTLSAVELQFLEGGLSSVTKVL